MELVEWMSAEVMPHVPYCQWHLQKRLLCLPVPNRNPLVLSLTIWNRCAHASEQWSEDEPRSLTVVESRHMDGISYKEDSDTSVLSDEDG